MNALSLAYSNAQKQQSWTDDPFEFKGFVTGVTKISQHQRNLNDYLQELVYSYGKHVGDNYELDLNRLSSPCQLELARLYIESIDREIEWACYGDDQTLNSDFLCAMLAMFKDSNPKTRAKFAQVTTVNVLKYYHQTLQDLIDTACQDYFCNEMSEAGYYAEQDMDHGDVVWRR
tara:strand:+ start:105 stop:626 length:522 start_codon:yes stop_codon:yes gene_type:complete